MKDSNVKCLELIRNEIGENIYHFKEGLPIISSINELNLGGNNIGEFGVIDVSTILNKAHNINSISLWGNNIYDNGFKHLSQALSHIEYLNVDTNKIGDQSASTLCIVLDTKSLKILSMANNDITSRGVLAIAESLKHSEVREISFESNRINDDGAFVIAACLRVNSFLMALNLSKNIIRVKSFDR